MNAGRFVPSSYCREDVIRYLFEACPIEIVLLLEIVLIAVLTPKIATIGDMPLDMKWFFHYVHREMRRLKKF